MAMTKKQLERELESVKEKNVQMNEAISYILNICLLWQKKNIGNYRAIKTINQIFVQKEKKQNESKS
tara:strand:+ start:660 stop:860 length:201 start_codon:yes stop_codon:yes gene_type:complete